MKIAVIGTGYVGLVSGACFAEWGNTVPEPLLQLNPVSCAYSATWGNTVVGVDTNVEKIAGLKRGQLPICEPGLDELVARNSAAGHLSFTADLALAVDGADIVLIAADTPPRIGQGDADLSFVYMAAKEIAPHLAENAVVVVKSTVPVGTGDVVEKIIASERRPGSFSVASNPEFLREGVAIDDFLNPDRVVIGVEDARARAALMALYGPLASRNTPIIVTRRRTSELIKYASNASLATKIAFINELANLCEEVGTDVSELALGIGLDKHIGTGFLNAGPGHGGSCFPKDTLALLRTAQDHGIALRLVEETVTRSGHGASAVAELDRAERF